MRTLYAILFLTLALTSCRQTEKSKEALSRAMDTYMNAELDEKTKIDSSLMLTNKALAYDDQNLDALHHKTTLLFRKKDLPGLLQVTDKLIELTDYPIYLGQKAMFLELDGKTEEAKVYYSQAIDGYDKLIQSDKQNFNLMLEYVDVLEGSGDSLKAESTLQELKDMHFENYSSDMIDLYREQVVSKKMLFQYWKGEIGYDQIGGNKN